MLSGRKCISQLWFKLEDIICDVIVGIAAIFGYTPLGGECNKSVYYSTEGSSLDLVLILIIIFIEPCCIIEYP